MFESQIQSGFFCALKFFYIFFEKVLRVQKICLPLQCQTTNKMETKKIILINEVVKETEKAVLVNLQVSWNYQHWISKNLWLPKNAIRVTENGKRIEMGSTFFNKISRENSFHGYTMKFERIVPLNIEMY